MPRSLNRPRNRRERPKTRKSHASQRRRFLQYESFEQRQLLAADIAGSIYNDVNGDGVRDHARTSSIKWPCTSKVHLRPGRLRGHRDAEHS